MREPIKEIAKAKMARKRKTLRKDPPGDNEQYDKYIPLQPKTNAQLIPNFRKKKQNGGRFLKA